MAANSETKVDPLGYKGHIVNFGNKAAGLTYEQAHLTRPGWCQWFIDEDFGEAKYPRLHAYLTAVGYRKTSETTHNMFQAEFTDDNNLEHIISLTLGRDCNYKIQKVIFEPLCNADIRVDVEYSRGSSYTKWLGSRSKASILFELKPRVTDDYPDILRQMRSQKRAFYVFNDEQEIHQALVTQRYTGKVDFDRVKQIFGDIPVIDLSREAR